MRTSFELKILASNLDDAKAAANSHISLFVGCKLSEVSDRVDVELKVRTIDIGEDSKKPLWSESTDLYEVTVFATLKQGVIKPF